MRKIFKKIIKTVMVLFLILMVVLITFLKSNGIDEDDEDYIKIAWVWFRNPGDKLSYTMMPGAPKFYEGMKVYVVGSISLRGIHQGIEYTVVNVDKDNFTIRLEDPSGYPAYNENEYATRYFYIGIRKDSVNPSTAIPDTVTDIPPTPAGPITDIPQTPAGPITDVPQTSTGDESEKGIWDKFKEEFDILSESIKGLKDKVESGNTIEAIDYFKDKIIPIIAAVLSLLCALYLAVVPAINKMKNAAERIKKSADGFDASASVNEEAKKYIEEVAKNDIERIAEMNKKIDTISNGYKKLFEVLYLVICNNDELVEKGIAETIAKDLGEYKKGEDENEKENTDKCENCDI